MKLITGLILILTLLFTGCGKTEEDNVPQIVWMQKPDTDLPDDRITITVASRQPDRDLAQYIIDFNNSQTQYRAVLIDYSRYSTAENPDGAWRFVASLIRSHAESISNPASGRGRRGVGILKSEMTAYLDTVSVFETVDKAGNVTGLDLLPTADGDAAHLRSDLTAAVREGTSAVFDSAAYPEYFRRTPFDLEEIIHEEEARFFGGTASAEDTAKAVASRAGIYLAEHE